jgi:hypothetical protein
MQNDTQARRILQERYHGLLTEAEIKVLLYIKNICDTPANQVDSAEMMKYLDAAKDLITSATTKIVLVENQLNNSDLN